MLGNRLSATATVGTVAIPPTLVGTPELLASRLLGDQLGDLRILAHHDALAVQHHVGRRMRFAAPFNQLATHLLRFGVALAHHVIHPLPAGRSTPSAW